MSSRTSGQQGFVRPSNEAAIYDTLSKTNKSFYDHIARSAAKAAQEHPELDTSVHTKFMHDYLVMAKNDEQEIQKSKNFYAKGGKRVDGYAIKKESEDRRNEFLDNFQKTELPKYGSKGRAAWNALGNEMQGPSIFKAGANLVYNKEKGGVQIGGIIGLLAGGFLASQIFGGLGGIMSGGLFSIAASIMAVAVGAWLGNKGADMIGGMLGGGEKDSNQQGAGHEQSQGAGQGQTQGAGQGRGAGGDGGFEEPETDADRLKEAKNTRGKIRNDFNAHAAQQFRIAVDNFDSELREKGKEPLSADAKNRTLQSMLSERSFNEWLAKQDEKTQERYAEAEATIVRRGKPDPTATPTMPQASDVARVQLDHDRAIGSHALLGVVSRDINGDGNDENIRIKATGKFIDGDRFQLDGTATLVTDDGPLKDAAGKNITINLPESLKSGPFTASDRYHLISVKQSDLSMVSSLAANEAQQIQQAVARENAGRNQSPMPSRGELAALSPDQQAEIASARGQANAAQIGGASEAAGDPSRPQTPAGAKPEDRQTGPRPNSNPTGRR